jgi:hypothetical protein
LKHKNSILVLEFLNIYLFTFSKLKLHVCDFPGALPGQLSKMQLHGGKCKIFNSANRVVLVVNKQGLGQVS